MGRDELPAARESADEEQGLVAISGHSVYSGTPEKEQTMEPEYPKSYATKIMALDAISFLIGVGLGASPFLRGILPGDIDTTVHVTLGALIAAMAVFRVL